MLKSVDERINELTRLIADEASTDAEKILAEGMQKKAEILIKGKQKADQLRADILEKAKLQAELLKEEKLAEITVKARMKAYDQREQLLEDTFNTVRALLPEIPQRTEYANALKGLIREAILQLQTDKVILHFDPASRKIIRDEDMKKISSEINVHISIGDDLDEGIGVIAQDEKGHRIYHNTLEFRLERDIDKLRKKAFDLLIGETT